MSKFSGFPEDLLKFLEDLARNNNREWFTENKERYRESVVTPVIDFINAIAEPLNMISDSFVADPRLNGGSMFRIYRDTRFAKDKRPYKENVGCQFRHTAGKSAHAPGFYVHIHPENVFVGGGIWMPPNPVLQQIRTAIVEHDEEWSQIINSAENFSFESERLKLPPRGFEAEHPLIDDIKRKSFFLKRNITPTDILEPEFLDMTVQAFKDAAPLMRFITKAMGLDF